MTDSQLDPMTANVSFTHEPLGEQPDGGYSFGRAYYWYSPTDTEPTIDNSDFRQQHAEIDNDKWHELFVAAFDRGERQFLLSLKTDRPEMFESADGLRDAFIGYIFGPCQPSEETIAALGITERYHAWRAGTLRSSDLPNRVPDDFPVALGRRQWRLVHEPDWREHWSDWHELLEDMRDAE